MSLIIMNNPLKNLHTMIQGMWTIINQTGKEIEIQPHWKGEVKWNY